MAGPPEEDEPDELFPPAPLPTPVPPPPGIPVHDPLVLRKPATRTAKQVIDQAIKENKPNELLLYTFAGLFVLLGAGLIISGIWRGEAWTALLGTLTSGLFYPAVHLAREIRRENLAIRLLEAPLSRATNEREASNALTDFFVHTFIKGPPANPGK